MPNSSISSLLVVAFTILFPACAQERSSNDRSWSIRMETSGGFGGGGRGNVLIDSDGHISYTKSATQSLEDSSCKAILTASELKELTDIIEAARPEEWKVQGPNAAAPDAYGYFLIVRKSKQLTELKWYDNTAERLPPDLKKLAVAVSKLTEAQATKCNARP